MALQARAEVTRHAIIDAAAELFETKGYGNVGLSDIIERAGITKGAFYYHFATKEAVATAIIVQADATLMDTVAGVFASPSTPMLERLIRANFQTVDITRQDRVVRVGNLLRQALNQISPSGAVPYQLWRTAIVDVVKRAVADGDLFEDLDVEGVGHTIWAGLVGTALLSDATGDYPFPRLTQVWTTILRGIVPAESLSYFTQFVARIAHQYEPPVTR